MLRTLCVTLALSASSALVAANAQASIWYKTGGVASTPYGHMQYCAKHRSDCRRHGGVSKLARSSLAKLQSVNARVNRMIKPVDDMKHHGVRELWSPNVRQGDCEDYVLRKRNMLLRAGFKPGHLLIGVGNRRGERHAVLVVRTQKGDMILDNMTDDVLPVNKSAMRVSKLQSPTDAKKWVKVTGKVRDVKRVKLK